MAKANLTKCPTCGRKAHNFEKEEGMDCVPPIEVLKFGTFELNRKYRDALFKKHPNYTTEEIVGTYLGHNSSFPSEKNWK